jgi:hypothetical protein
VNINVHEQLLTSIFGVSASVTTTAGSSARLKEIFTNISNVVWVAISTIALHWAKSVAII